MRLFHINPKILLENCDYLFEASFASLCDRLKSIKVLMDRPGTPGEGEGAKAAFQRTLNAIEREYPGREAEALRFVGVTAETKNSTKWKVGDKVSVNSRPYVVDSIYKDGEKWKLKLKNSDGLFIYANDDDSKIVANVYKGAPNPAPKPQPQPTSSSNSSNAGSSSRIVDGHFILNGVNIRVCRFTDMSAGKRGSDKIWGYAYKKDHYEGVTFYGRFGGTMQVDPANVQDAMNTYKKKITKKENAYSNVNEGPTYYMSAFMQAVKVLQ